MQKSTWISVADYSDRLSAEAMLGFLTGEGLPAYIESDAHVPGLGSNFSVFVPPDHVHRAKWILQQAHVTESELTYLATGEVGGDAGDERS